MFWVALAGKTWRDYFRRLWLTRRIPGTTRPELPCKGLPGKWVWAVSFAIYAPACLAIAHIGVPFLSFQGIPSPDVILWINDGYGFVLFTAGLGIAIGGIRLAQVLRLPRLRFSHLPAYPSLVDGVVLGALYESGRDKKPQWAIQSIQALTGNILKTGSIGSGKSQDLLRLLLQILQNFSRRPALLAIDPKRTFIRELYARIKKLGMENHLVYMSLHGSVKMNPIWREDILTKSGFTEVANTLKLASINFLGTSGDNRFWEQQSFNLLKNCLIYCGAKHCYFTFNELYRAIVTARDENLAGEMTDLLAAKTWGPEEIHNIELAIGYFKDEFMRMDEKIRTSVLVTATGFLNEFLEYRVARIFSPRKEEINFHSMADAVRKGKLMLLSIENEALARSIGTLLKLQFQEAIIARVNDDDRTQEHVAVLAMDEYQNVVTSGGGSGLGDERYLSVARESNAVTIAATQSVSSLENTIRNDAATRELLQNFKTCTFGHTTDPRTVRLYQESYGISETHKMSQNFSESGASTGTLDATGRAPTISEGFSVQTGREYQVTAKEFARLRPFETYAQIFDGVDTHFEKLFIKPYYLADPATPHQSIIAAMKKRASAQVRSLVLVLALLGLGAIVTPLSALAVDFPNICSVVSAPEFRSCLNFEVGACFCPFPPRPCAKISYRVPQTFIEIWPQTTDTFFRLLPGTNVQLAASNPIPFGDEEDNASYAFQARALPVPLAELGLAPLPCGGTRMDKLCFDVLSEHFGTHWRTGHADSLQPHFLAWSLAPKACLLKGAATSAVAEVMPSIGMDTGACGYPLPPVPSFTPSSREACNGWGLFYPRYGVYEGGSRSAAALMIAARLKSLGTEITRTVPGYPGEKWQMIYPQSSSCFSEGQNLGFLETLGGLREERRILARPEGYLFTIWRNVSCCQDLSEVATTLAAISALELACKATGNGGV